MKITVHLHNGGKSPALHVLPHLIFTPWISAKENFEVPTLKNTILQECDKPKPSWRDDLPGTVILPGVPASLDMVSYPIGTKTVKVVIGELDFDITDETWKDFPRTTLPLVKPTLRLYLVGCIDYFDQFETSHRTRICKYWLHGLGSRTFREGLVDCPKGNFADWK
jgi:hypothetical protein